MRSRRVSILGCSLFEDRIFFFFFISDVFSFLGFGLRFTFDREGRAGMNGMEPPPRFASRENMVALKSALCLRGKRKRRGSLRRRNFSIFCKICAAAGVARKKSCLYAEKCIIRCVYDVSANMKYLFFECYFCELYCKINDSTFTYKLCMSLCCE